MRPIVDFTVFGEPVGKGRPKFTRATGRAYTPAKTVAAERLIRSEWLRQSGVVMPKRTPLLALIACNMERPKSHYTASGALSAAGRHQGEYAPLSKPDIDNVAKLVFDALEGYAYEQDQCIVSAAVSKHWADNASTRIYITTWEGDY